MKDYDTRTQQDTTQQDTKTVGVFVPNLYSTFL
jgi:hypothetical protein